jgi:hypothetical protein
MIDKSAHVRGRPPKAVRRRANLTLRIRDEVRATLQKGAGASGRSVSEEAETRIEQSYRDQDSARLFSDLYYGRKLAALLEVIGRALRDAGTHAAANAARAGLGSGEWLDNPYGFDIAVKAATRVLDRLRPLGEITAPPAQFPAEAMMSEAIANGLLNAIAHPDHPGGDFMEEWAAAVRARLGRLRTRLSDFDYDVGAQSAALPSATTPGILLYDTDNRDLLEEDASKRENGGSK